MSGNKAHNSNMSLRKGDKWVNNMPNRDQFSGCLIGGALGDALGYVVEFDRWEEIAQRFGANGIQKPVANGITGKYIISDDTQMTLFTAEGIIWARRKEEQVGLSNVTSCCFYSYQRWLHTQFEELAQKDYEWVLDDERLGVEVKLLACENLFHLRAPGTTCLNALKNAKDQNYGTIEQPVNDSKGCGGVMRVAPIGLYYYQDYRKAFSVAAKVAAITHGHPSGYLSAGALASIIANLLDGKTLSQAITMTLALLTIYAGHQETVTAIKEAVALASLETPKRELLVTLGEGWVAEECLAIALYCALSYPNDYLSAVRLAVNHSGDSDSTGAVCGNLLGVMLGESKLPIDWVARIECRDELTQFGDIFYQDTFGKTI